MYAEYKNVPIHRVQGCTQSTGVYTEYRGGEECISLYTEYKLSMSYDTESSQPDDDLYDRWVTTTIHIRNPVSVYIVLVELIIPGGLENLHSTTHTLTPAIVGASSTFDDQSSQIYSSLLQAKTYTIFPWLGHTRTFFFSGVLLLHESMYKCRSRASDIVSA